MTVSETFQVVASTPPTDLPHTTAAAEIARLPTYLSVAHQRDDGTDYIVTDAAYKDEAGNAGRIYVQRNDTDNSIEAIQSKVNGVWTNFKATADSIAAEAVLASKLAAAAIGGGLIRANDAVSVDVDGTNVTIASGKVTVLRPRLTATISGTITLGSASQNLSLASVSASGFTVSGTSVIPTYTGWYWVSAGLALAPGGACASDSVRLALGGAQLAASLTFGSTVSLFISGASLVYLTAATAYNLVMTVVGTLDATWAVSVADPYTRLHIAFHSAS